MTRGAARADPRAKAWGAKDMATQQQNQWIFNALGLTIPGLSPGKDDADDGAPPDGAPAPEAAHADDARSGNGAADAGGSREDDVPLAPVVAAKAKEKQVKDASDKVTAMSDDDLKKLSSADKVKMVKDLFANGKPTGDARKAQIKIYKDMDIDPAFKKREEERADRMAKTLSSDKDLQEARKNWTTLSAADKVKALKKIIAAQSKEYGFDPPQIETETTAPYTAADGSKHIVNGHFEASDGKLHLNVHAESSISQDFESALNTTLHENGHNYQARLVKDMRAGKIKPGDPDYAQAAMFDVNEDGDAYIPPKEDYDAYVKQPEEDHSRTMGADMSAKINKALDEASAAH